MNTTPKQSDPDWFERNVNLLIGGLVLVCAGTLLAQWLYSPFFNEHHPAHFPAQTIFGFEAAVGFVAFVMVVFLGRLLRIFVKRKEDYYDL